MAVAMGLGVPATGLRVWGWVVAGDKHLAEGSGDVLAVVAKLAEGMAEVTSATVTAAAEREAAATVVASMAWATAAVVGLVVGGWASDAWAVEVEAVAAWVAWRDLVVAVVVASAEDRSAEAEKAVASWAVGTVAELREEVVAKRAAAMEAVATASAVWAGATVAVGREAEPQTSRMHKCGLLAWQALRRSAGGCTCADRRSM